MRQVLSRRCPEAQVRTRTPALDIRVPPSSEAVPAPVSSWLEDLALDVNLHCHRSAVPVPRLICGGWTVGPERGGELAIAYLSLRRNAEFPTFYSYF